MTRLQKDGFEFYFALDTHCKVRDYAIRNDTGEGFEQFIQRNVEGQRSGKNYPDYWLFQYTIPDGYEVGSNLFIGRICGNETGLSEEQLAGITLDGTLETIPVPEQ